MVAVVRLEQDDLIARVGSRLARGIGFCLYTVNLDHLVKRRSDAAFRAIYARGTFVTADGAPLVALARRQGARLARTTGADLIEPLCALAARTGAPLYFYGSTLPMLESAAAALMRRHPGLIVSGCEAPPFGLDPRSDAVAAAGERMASSGARLCLVALGAPKQEAASDFLFARHPGIGFLCIGAALDFVAGGQKRAPRLFQNLGLEWLWRLGTDPRRLALRYVRCALLLADLAILAPLRQRAIPS